MNRYSLVLLGTGVLVGLAISQVAQYKSGDEQIQMTFKGFQMKAVSESSTRLILTGGVHLKSFKQGLDIVADHATTYLTTKRTTAKAPVTTMESVHAVGRVVLTKDATGAGSSRVSSVKSEVADYRDGSPQPHADFSGTVELTDLNSAKKTTVHAFGNVGHATFTSALGTKDSTLSQATLTGAVVVNVDQAPVGASKVGKLVVHCAHLSYTPSPSGSSVLILSGEVRMQGTQGGLVNGSMGPLRRITIHLDGKGQVTDVDTGNIN